MFRTPSFAALEKKLAPADPLPQDKAMLRTIGRAFRGLWQAKSMLEIGFPDVGGTPKVTPGACLFAAATARALFGANIQGNWQHLWAQGEGLIDLTGLADISISKAIIEHIAMLRERGYIVRGTGSGTWSVKLLVGERNLTYPPVDTATYFQHDPDMMQDRDFRSNFATVVPRALVWAKTIREALEENHV